MKFQLVFQFEAGTIKDFDFFLDLENVFISALASDPDAVVDGHDFGMGEFNIFIHSGRPRESFSKIGEVLGNRHPELQFSAGCRALDEADYIVLWPPLLATFSIA